MNNPLTSVMRRLDGFQRAHRGPAFVFGVMKKYGDDRGGTLAALVTYYSFLSFFPLLLVLVTVLGLVVGSQSDIAGHIQRSALAQFPVIGPQLQGRIGSLHGSPLALTVGLLGLLWGSLGASQAGQYAMAQVWNVPLVERPGFLGRLGRSLLLLAVLGLFLVVSTSLSGFTTFAGSQGPLIRVGSGVLSVLVAVGLFTASFRLLTPSDVPTADLLPGAALGGAAWAGLQLAGTALVSHALRHMSQTYSVFATVLGLMWWLYLSAQVVLYASELNVVRSRHLWPRSLVQPPLTPADRRMLVTYAAEQQRRPDQRVSVGFDEGDNESGQG